MAGTGLYCVKVTPTHNDDTQSGAPSGQVVTLTTGGLGTASAWAGGYVTNATRSETRSIVSHTNTTVTLEGSLANWLNGDDLDIYDAWDSVTNALAQLITDQGSGVAFTATQTCRIYGGTYTENVSLNDAVLNTQELYPLIFEASSGTPIIQNSGASHTWAHAMYDNYVLYRGIHFKNDQSNKNSFYGYTCARMHFTDCIFENVVAIGYGATFRGHSGNFRDCRFVGGIVSISTNDFERCSFEGVNTFQALGGTTRFRSCTFRRASGGTGFFPCGVGYPGHVIFASQCSFIANGAETFFDASVAYGRIVLRNCIIENFAKGFELGSANPTPGAVDSDSNCFHDITTLGTYAGVDYTTLADWQAATIPSDFCGHTASPDAHSIEADPLLTAPATDDFSLTTGSPCLHTGAGAGVTKGINGVAFDAHWPDIGAWSSGAHTSTPPGSPCTTTFQYSLDGGKTWNDDAKGDSWPLNGQWKSSTAFTLGQHVQPLTPNGYVYECTQAGTTGGTEPTWPTTPGNTVLDSGVIWTCETAGPRAIRYRLPATPHKMRRVMVKLSTTDAARWGVRVVRIKAVPRDQEHNRGDD